jgi:hypothetical protein
MDGLASKQSENLKAKNEKYAKQEGMIRDLRKRQNVLQDQSDTIAQ